MTNEEFTVQFDELKRTIDAMAADIAALKVPPDDDNEGERDDHTEHQETDDFFKSVFGDKQ